MWEQTALDEFEPAHLTFDSGGAGELSLVAINASIDYRIGTRDRAPIVEFTWAGAAEACH